MLEARVSSVAIVHTLQINTPPAVHILLRAGQTTEFRASWTKASKVNVKIYIIYSNNDNKRYSLISS